MFVLACPGCPSAEVVRSAVFGEAFWSTFALLPLPLVVIAACGWWVHRLPLSPPEDSQ